MTKTKLLGHYAQREPGQFVQLDGFNDLPPDGIVEVDGDGHSLFSTRTTELMRGATVRILIKPDTAKSEAVALIRKLADWLERDEGAAVMGDQPDLPDGIGLFTMAHPVRT